MGIDAMTISLANVVTTEVNETYTAVLSVTDGRIVEVVTFAITGSINVASISNDVILLSFMVEGSIKFI